MLRFICVLFLVAYFCEARYQRDQRLLSLAVGPCMNGVCPFGYRCFQMQCVPWSAAPTMSNYFDSGRSNSPCIRGVCPNESVCRHGWCYWL